MCIQVQLNNTTDLLQSKGIKTKKVTQTDEYVLIEAETEKIKKCPYCHSNKIWIHDHRHRTIKDTPIYGKKAIIHLKTTRYDCKHCGKRFKTETDLVPKKHTKSKRLTLTIEWVPRCPTKDFFSFPCASFTIFGVIFRVTSINIKTPPISFI